MDSGFAPSARPGMTVDDSAQVETGLVGRGFGLAQNGPKLFLERRERLHQRRGIELPGGSETIGIVGWIVRKMRAVGFPIQHCGAPWQRDAPCVLHRLAAVNLWLPKWGIWFR